jgi:chemotaxis protein CheZ
MPTIAEDAPHKRSTVSGRDPSLPDPSMVTAVIESVLSSLSDSPPIIDARLYREVEQLADFIHAAKREIAALRPVNASERHLQMATDELDAVVEATAVATGTILGAAEEIERRVHPLPVTVAQPITAEVTRIYEACNFHDITGQRITKVVGALKHIEERIDSLLMAFGQDVPMGGPSTPASVQDKLLNGPQLPALANDQSDIDAILATFD